MMTRGPKGASVRGRLDRASLVMERAAGVVETVEDGGRLFRAETGVGRRRRAEMAAAMGPRRCALL